MYTIHRTRGIFYVAWSRDLTLLSLLFSNSVVALSATLPKKTRSQIEAAREKASLNDHATENISRIRCMLCVSRGVLSKEKTIIESMLRDVVI